VSESEQRNGTRFVAYQLDKRAAVVGVRPSHRQLACSVECSQRLRLASWSSRAAEHEWMNGWMDLSHGDENTANCRPGNRRTRIYRLTGPDDRPSAAAAAAAVAGPWCGCKRWPGWSQREMYVCGAGRRHYQRHHRTLNVVQSVAAVVLCFRVNISVKPRTAAQTRCDRAWASNVQYG